MLEVMHLNAYYGKSHVLFDVCLDVEREEIVGLVGRNGMGKSTALKAIIGEVSPRGSVTFKGEEIAGLKTYEIANRGLGYVPEDRAIFSDLTVRQNLMMGIKPGKKVNRWRMEDMYEVFPVLKARIDVAGGNLSGGEQQMLTLCRTLMGDPDLVMIDEPTEGLAPMVVQLLAKMFEEMRKRGISILLVEQKLAFALKVSGRLLVMGHGSIVFQGTVDDFNANERIRKDWLEV